MSNLDYLKLFGEINVSLLSLSTQISGGARKINQWVRLHNINESLLLINNNYSEIRPKLLGSAEPNDYMPAPPLAPTIQILTRTFICVYNM
jgi:hypothetical protein